MSEQIFISYSKKDKDFANRLADDLSSSGFDVWIDRSIGGGERWRESIESNLRDSKDVIIVVSPNSMQSDWVRHEGSLAYGWGKKLYPVLIAPVAALPPWLEEYQWISFVNASYQTAFEALRTTLTPPNPTQTLLDERVNVYRQTGELFGEELIRVVESARSSLAVSNEVDEILQKSKQAIETRRQNEMGQRQALAEAQKSQQATAKKSRAVVLLLSSLFALAVLVAVLSFSPYSTGWQRLQSFDAIKSGQGAYFVTMDTHDPERIFVSDYTSGGFYKSTFSKKECWSKFTTLPSQAAIVTYAVANRDHLYLLTSGGLFTSADAGQNWAQVDASASLNGFFPTALAVNPDNPLRVFVGTMPAGLFVSENGGKDWHPATIPAVDGAGIQALAHNGTDLVLAIDQDIWTSKDSAQSWTMILDGNSPILGLSMVGGDGRFFIARGELGIGDMDVNSDTLRSLADSPAAGSIQSISASNDARYATDENGIWYWRLWMWTNFNWVLARLGIPIPCH